MAEGKWTVSWQEHFHGHGMGAWVVTAPNGDDQDCHDRWHVALRWAFEYADEDRIEAVVAEAGRGWSE